MDIIRVFGSASKGFDQMDARVASKGKAALVFGYQAYQQDVEEISSYPLDDVYIFVQRSMERYFELCDKGYVNVFVVPSVRALTTDEVAGYLKNSRTYNKAVLKFHRLQLFGKYYKSNGQLLDGLGELISSLQRRDAGALARCINLYLDPIAKNLALLKQTLSTAQQTGDISKLAAEMQDLRVQYDRAAKELEKFKGNLNSKETIFSDDTLTELKEKYDILASSYQSAQTSIKGLEEQAAAQLQELQKRDQDITKLSEELSEVRLVLTDERKRNGNLNSELKSIEGQLVRVQNEHDTKIAAMDVLLSNLRADSEQKVADFNDHLVKLQNEIVEMGAENESLKAAKVEQDAIIADLTHQCGELRADKETLQDSFDDADEKLKRALGVIDRNDKVINDFKQREDAFNKDLVIKQLQEELGRAASSSVNPQYLEKQLPLVSSNMSLNCEKIIVFREIKPVIYMNSFIDHLNTMAIAYLTESRQRGDSRQPFLILIFDYMTDQHRFFKYRKAKYTFNEAPKFMSTGKMVTVANRFDIDFLENTLQLHSYRYIFVIDRLGFMAPVVAHPKGFDFYFIDSIEDITDFELDRKKCIIYGKTDTIQCMSTVEPNGSLFGRDEVARQSRLLKDHVVTKILQSLRMIAGAI